MLHRTTCMFYKTERARVEKTDGDCERLFLLLGGVSELTTERWSQDEDGEM